MTYKDFKRKVFELIDKAGGGISVLFFFDKKKGLYYANFSNGILIMGNRSCPKVEVRWGQQAAGNYIHRSITLI